MTRKFLLAIVILICAGYGIAGLWPFSFLPGNHVTWLPEGKGIALGRNSIIYSESPLDLRNGAGAVTIELYLQSGLEPAKRLTSILSLYGGELPENLMIGQLGSELFLSTPVWDARDARSFRQVGGKAGLRPGLRRFIAITSGARGTAFYVDGVLTRAYPKLTPRPDTLQGRLVLGAAPDGHSAWEGKLFGVAILSRALAPAEISRHQGLWTGAGLQALTDEPGLSALYLFDEGSGRTIKDHSPSGSPLVIPESYRVLHRTVLLPPWKDSRRIWDFFVNIVGFVPFGFFYFIYRMKTAAARPVRNVVMTALVSGIISASIELLQVFLPSRGSQLTDIVCNTGGALIGVLLATVALRVNKPLRPQRELNREDLKDLEE